MGQLKGLDHFGVSAPGHHPALLFVEAIEAHGQLHAAVLQGSLLLRLVQAFLTDLIGDKFVEANHDLRLLVTCDDGKTSAQPFFE